MKSRVKFAVREFPRARAEIGITSERLAHGFRSRENKMADPPPRTTHSQISPATQATPWQEILLTLYGDIALNLLHSLSKEE